MGMEAIRYSRSDGEGFDDPINRYASAELTGARHIGLINLSHCDRAQVLLALQASLIGQLRNTASANIMVEKV